MTKKSGPAHVVVDGSNIATEGRSMPTLEQLITPLGGGGLIAGTAIASQAWGVEVYGVEPAGAADTVESLEQGRIVDSFVPDTVADGLRALVGVRNFQVIKKYVQRVFTVSDDDIREMMVLFWKELKMLIEPSSATVLASISESVTGPTSNSSTSPTFTVMFALSVLVPSDTWTVRP